jgi:hypothetical protein
VYVVVSMVSRTIRVIVARWKAAGAGEGVGTGGLHLV